MYRKFIYSNIKSDNAAAVRASRLLDQKDINEYIQKRLKEFVGHSPLQVAAGAVLGILLAVGMEYLYV